MPAAPTGARPAIYIDRDGTLHRELSKPLEGPADLELFEGVERAVQRLNEAGLWVVVITNQSAVARGWIEPSQLERIHAALRQRLATAGARIDLILHCPHHPSEGFAPYRRTCACRKPLPGLLTEAERRLPIERRGSWMIGDAGRDLAAARALDVPGILVATGKGERERPLLEQAGTPPEHCVADLPAAVDAILGAR